MEMEAFLARVRAFDPPQSLVEGFWRAWWGWGGREMGNPARIYTPAYPEDFPYWVAENEEANRPCHLSVNRYAGKNQISEISELFFEFDGEGDPPDLEAAWREARGLAEALERHYNATPLITYSGRRGFHLHLSLSPPIQTWALSQDHIKLLYRELAGMILRGLGFEHLDPNVVGDVKRLARIPYTRHEATGLPCVPVDPGLRPVLLTGDTLVSWRGRGLGDEIVRLAAERVNRGILMKALRRRFPGSIRYSNGRIRPCIEEAVRRFLDGGAGHLMRLAIVREYGAVGWGADSIIQLFSSQADYDEETSRYYVEQALRNPARPFTCSTIRGLGFCLGEKCPIYRGRSMADDTLVSPHGKVPKNFGEAIAEGEARPQAKICRG
jgi:hypothetical protein